MTHDSVAADLCTRTLRRRWKPHKLRLQSESEDQSTSIRFHRACSWLARYEGQGREGDHDLDLLTLWIAFNALYGQWDPQRQEPKPDRICWRAFVDSILQLDRTGHVAAALTTHRQLVMVLLEDEYLSSIFWKEPCSQRAGRSKRDMWDARTWYAQQRWVMILDKLLDRIYLQRCQLVHGAATYGGKLNRRTLKRCVMMMERLLPVFLTVWIDQGADVDWGPMCYPPLRFPGAAAAAERPQRPR